MASPAYGTDSRDSDAPIPYIREKRYIDFKADTVEFKYTHSTKTTKDVERTDIDKDGNVSTSTSKETVSENKVLKATLKTYGKSEREDIEHFFEAFEKMQKSIDDVWKAASANKTNDASVLFNAMETMLTGTANTDWHDVMTGVTGRNWETYKVTTAKYICEKVLPDDAYMEQTRYMQERNLPRGMSVATWWDRFQTLNRYILYAVKDISELKEIMPDATWPDWWAKGGITPAEQRRILTTKVPGRWQDELRRIDVGHSYRNKKTLTELVNYFKGLETLEGNGRQRARITPTGRTNSARNNNRQYYNNRQTQTNQQRIPAINQINQNNYRRTSHSRAPIPGGSNQSRNQQPLQFQRTYQPRPDPVQSRQQTHQSRPQPRQNPQPDRVASHSGQFGGQRTNPYYGGGFNRQPGNTYPRRNEAYYQHAEQPRSSPRRGAPQVETVYEEEEEEECMYDNDDEVEEMFLNEGNLTQQELTDAWNESLYLDSRDQGYNPSQVFDHADHEYDEGFFGDDETDGTEEYHGAWRL